MITRHPINKRETLYSEHLNLYPSANQAAKIFAKWLSEHPEYSAEDVDMRIDSVECEEDHYGNGGGWDETCVIYKTRQETQEECNGRINEEERAVIDKFSEKLWFFACDFSREFFGRSFEAESDENKQKCCDLILKMVEERLK